MSMFVFNTVVLLLTFGSQRLVAGAAACSHPSTQLVAPDDCTVIWKSNEDQPLQTETFDNCTFTKQHIIATLPNGVDWEIWEVEPTAANGLKLGTATFYNVGGAYHADWDNSGDFISRAGLQFDKPDPSDPTKMKKGCAYTAYGAITAEYRFTKSVNDKCNEDVAGGYSYIGVYGWARNPLTEYYIIDDWFGNKYRLSTEGPVDKSVICYDIKDYNCKIAEYDLDDGKYELYFKKRGPTYSVNGDDQCFYQYYAIRTTTRQCGTIHIDQHFAKWATYASEGVVPLNELYETKILVESGGGKGWIDFTHLRVTKQNDCTTGGQYNVGTFPTDTYTCPGTPFTPYPSDTTEYYGSCIPEETDGGGAQVLWNKKAWLAVIALSVLFLFL